MALAACGPTSARGDATPQPATHAAATVTPAPALALTPTPALTLTPTPALTLTPTPALALTPTPTLALPPAPPLSLPPTPPLALTPTPPSPAPQPWPACTQSASCPFGPDAWLETDAGYVNRFLVAGPITARALRKQRDLAALAAALGDTPETARTFADPILELAPDGRLDKRDVAPVWLLRARVYSDVARDVAAKAGATGRVHLVIAGQTLLDDAPAERLLRDALRLPVRLAAGWNDVLVRLEKVSPFAVQFSLRLRDLDGRPLPGLAWDLPPARRPRGAPESPEWCNAFNLSLSMEATPSGFVLHGTSAPQGLLPPPQRTPRLALQIDGRPEPPQPLAPSALVHGDPARVSAPLTAEGDTVTVALTLDGAACLTSEVRPRPALARRLADAEAALAVVRPGLAEGSADSLAYLAQRARERLERAAPHLERLERTPPHLERAEEDLATLERLLAVARAGRDPYAGLAGVVTRAYRSRLDGTLQRYVVLVPPSYARRAPEPFPLIVASHGLFYSPEDMARIVTGHATGPGGSRWKAEAFDFDDRGALIVAHDGYDNAGQRAPGELDLLRVIEEMKRAYRVDPRRVTLTGFSLGGSVGFWVPLHHPDLFAATAPLCGYPNLTEYRTVQAVKKRPWEPRLLASEGVVEYADNGRYLPLRIVHGGQDRPERSAVVVDRYKLLGYGVDFTVLPGEGHNIWDKTYKDGSLVVWLAKQRRPETPNRPRLRTARYRWSKVDWLRLDRFARYGEFGELEGRLGPRDLGVRTKNVAAFTLLASALTSVAGEPRTLAVDGQELGRHPLTGDLSLARDEAGRWRVTDFPDVPKGHKRAGVEGPLRDVWFDPLVIVYGTADPLQTEANRITAEDVSRYSPWISATAPMVRDVDATAADLRGRHLVLIGNPASNTVTREIADQLPVRFEPHALTFNGARYEGDEVGIATVWPSPFDPDRTLVLFAGVGPEGTLSARYLPELAPDWLIFDSRLRARWWDYLLGPREILAGGFYDEAWRP